MMEPLKGFGPGGIDCEEVIRDVYLFLDNECDATLRAKLQQHLDACHGCLQSYNLEVDVKKLVHRCCTNEAAPETLRMKLQASFTQITFESRSE